jgi:hypothetical protein
MTPLSFFSNKRTHRILWQHMCSPRVAIPDKSAMITIKVVQPQNKISLSFKVSVGKTLRDVAAEEKELGSLMECACNGNYDFCFLCFLMKCSSFIMWCTLLLLFNNNSRYSSLLYLPCYCRERIFRETSSNRRGRARHAGYGRWVHRNISSRMSDSFRGRVGWNDRHIAAECEQLLQLK